MPGPEQCDTNARDSDSRDAGNLAIGKSFRVCEPEQLALQRTHLGESGIQKGFRIEVLDFMGIDDRQLRFRNCVELDRRGTEPVIAHQVRSDPEQVASAGILSSLLWRFRA
jgi:hypothetical protein